MKKQLFCFITTLLLFSKLFCHEAQKQTAQIKADILTTKWDECKKNWGSEKQLYSLQDFSHVIKEAAPDDTMLYYFPEAETIYARIKKPAEELSRINLDETSDGTITELKNQINEAIRDWEILHKNITQFELEQLNYSYKLLISVIIISSLFSLIFLIMYLLTSKSQRENKSFTRQMIQTQEAERERISNELHDSVCQDLRVLQFQLEKNESIELCKKIASDVRNTCYALTPSDLNEGILEAIISLCAVSQKQSGINIILSIQDDIKENSAFNHFSKNKNLNIYRIVQEIITNAIKHSNAENISILIRSSDYSHFKIIISDDGTGFDLKTALKKKKHFGLKNIQTRAESLQGEISFNSEPGEGTHVTLTIPYESKTESFGKHL